MCKSKLREGLMLMFNNEPGTFLTEGSGGAVRKSANFLKRAVLITLFSALGFMLSAPSLVQAEDLQQGTPAEQPSTNAQPVNTADPAGLIASAVAENQAPAKANTQADDGLEIGPVTIGQPVREAGEPKVDTISVGNKTISGNIKMGSGQRKAKNLTFTITVTVNRKAGGTEEKTVSIPPTQRKTTWSVTLDSALAEGDKVTVTEVGETSKTITIEVQPSLKNQHNDDLKMPKGEIWIEQTVANIVNEEEHAEAFDLLKAANPTIAKDFKSIEFSIEGVQKAFYTVTYTDNSVTDKIEAPELTIKQVTETSIGATVGDITVVDNVIKGKLQGDGPFNDIKVQIYTKITEAGLAIFKSDNGCKTDKNSSKPVEATVDGTTGEFTYKIPSTTPPVELNAHQVVGVSVKEKNKFVSCGTSKVKLPTPKKTNVRDPKKLTKNDKKDIINAIKDAYKAPDGTSKLPDGTGFNQGLPAIIEFDEGGNVSIISPNDVDVEWDNDGRPVYPKNADGTIKVNDKSKVIKIPAKDLVKNIAPKSPEIKVDTDTGKVTITPPAYKDPGDDTDLLSYTFTYKNASGVEQTGTVKRTVDGDGKTTWSSDDATVDANTGVITLKVEDIKVGGTIKATAKDNGGLEGDTNKLDSDEAIKVLETATVSYDRNGGTGEMTGKTVNKGAEYEILANAFKAPENEKFETWKIGDTEHKAKDKIRVKEDTTIQAIWQDIKVTVSYKANGGSGSMDSATMKKGNKYKLLANGFTAPENQKFKGWKIGDTEYSEGAEITVNEDTTVEAVWKDIMVNVSFDAGEGSGTMNKETVKKGREFKLPDSKFEAPKNKEFKGWKIGEKEYQVGDEITVNDNTTVTAIWKDIEYKVTFDGNGGTGKMDEQTVKKGDSFKLPANGFTPPTGKEFNGWQIGDKTYQVAQEIPVERDVTVKALWKNKPVPPSTTPGKDKSGNQAKPQPKPQKQNPTAGGNLSKTGANGMYSLYASLLLLATGGLFVISRRRRNQH